MSCTWLHIQRKLIARVGSLAERSYMSLSNFCFPFPLDCNLLSLN